MIILNGKKVYKKELDNLKVIKEANGFDSYDGSNWQFYTLYYNAETQLVKLQAYGASCWANNFIKYYENPKEFAKKVCIENLFREIDEDDKLAMQFIEKATE